MRRINILYLLLIPLIYLVYKLNVSLGDNTILFYGFAENKETELSHDQYVLIDNILVTPGEHVVAGQLLMQVKHANIEFKRSGAVRDLERMKTLDQQRIADLKARIEQLKARKKAKQLELQTEIDNFQSTMEFNRGLLKDLSSLDSANVISGASPSDKKLASLKSMLVELIAPFNVQIDQLNTELKTVNRPSNIVQQRLSEEVAYYEKEQARLDIIAPTDGIVGNILCKEGENLSAFSTLINFYEPKPTLVKGFVHESQLLEVDEGDSLKVSSSLHAGNQISGIVVGMGSRIVEIPERLRKVPEIKTYGREILIRIPAENPFLQKEKVMLNTLQNSGSTSFISLGNFFAQEEPAATSTTSYKRVEGK